MVKLPRRQLLEIGAAALVVGPSVLFSRTGFASPKIGGTNQATDMFLKNGWLSAGNFTIKLAGMDAVLPHVKSVDLGSIKLTPGAAPVFSYLKIALNTATDALKTELGFSAPDAASKDAAKMTIKWAPEYTRQASASGQLNSAIKLAPKPAPEMKWEINLLGATNKVALTYNVLKAIPETLVANKAGESLITYKIGSIETTLKKPKKPALDGIKGESLKFKLDFLGLGFTALEVVKTSSQTMSMSKAVYDWIDGTTETTTQKVAIKKIDAMTWKMKVQATVVVSSFSPDSQPKALIKSLEKTGLKVGIDATLDSGPSLGGEAVQSGGFEKPGATVQSGGFEKPAATKMQDFHYEGALLTSIDMPKLVTGSTAPVTQTLNFTIPAKG